MANWWEMTDAAVEADEEVKAERACAYFDTLFRDDVSRCVMLDIGKMCYADDRSAEASLALIRLYHMLKARAGLTITGEKAAIDAEADSIG
ncbi:hypothetical protein LCGC14_2605670 [marine sediment metagenome]|uniref:Uncharacterized protein n=1 Tax=marine sediment metagenome TaxID=412755 RepID=A0A0F9D051_9ZZZZ